jgi:hypothetical protein
MNSIEIALVDFAWFANDFTVQNRVEAWNEYATEGDATDVEAYLEYAEEANYDDHITDVMDGILEEFYEGR